MATTWLHFDALVLNDICIVDDKILNRVSIYVILLCQTQLT